MKSFNPALILSFLPKIVAYIPVTILVLLCSIFLSLIIGSLFYIIRTKKIPLVSQLVRVLMSYMRGTPVITQLFMVYFGIPTLLKGIGIDITRIPGIYFVVFTYGMYYGAGVSENLRSSITAVGLGQFEASYSIGMTEFTAFRRIIFPQMVVVALPNFINIFVRSLKNTSLAFSVGVIEMMTIAQLLGNKYARFIEAYVSISIIYYLMYLIVVRVSAIIEKNVNKHIVV